MSIVYSMYCVLNISILHFPPREKNPGYATGTVYNTMVSVLVL